MFLFSPRRRRTGFIAPLLMGAGGLALGAALVFFLTPSTGSQARRYVRDLLKRRQGDGSVDAQLEAMENEGGLSREVSPSHS